MKPRSAWEVALASAARHDAAFERRSRASRLGWKRKRERKKRRSEAAKKGWERRLGKAELPPSAIIEAEAERQGPTGAIGVARRHWLREITSRKRQAVLVGIEEHAYPWLAKEAIDDARLLGVHPDDWAEDVAYEYDLGVGEVYDEFFYPAGGSTTW